MTVVSSFESNSYVIGQFVPLIASQVLGYEVFQVLHTNIEKNKWWSLQVSQVGGDLKLWGLQVLRVDCTWRISTRHNSRAEYN